tara:strand:- start:206 stop:397 length:192 start_codon:yes stop_codon:yes gene_type:complete
MKIIIKKNEWDEYEVPTVTGISGSDCISYESSKQDAIDTAHFHHGQDAQLAFRSGTYSINEEN